MSHLMMARFCPAHHRLLQAAFMRRRRTLLPLTMLVTTFTSIAVGYLLRRIARRVPGQSATSGVQPQLHHAADLDVVFRFLHHELCSAASGLHAYLTLVGRDPADPELLAGVRATVEHVGQLASRLSVLSRDRQLPAHRDIVDLGAVLAEQIAQLRCFGGAVRPTISVAPSALHIMGDRTALAMALNTAIRNSLESAPLAMMPVVTVGVVCTDRLRITIEDDEPGFPPAILRRQRPLLGMTTKPHGSGTGLALIDGVAQLHGGRAVFSNRPEGGARVVLELPLTLLQRANLPDAAAVTAPV